MSLVRNEEFYDSLRA